MLESRVIQGRVYMQVELQDDKLVSLDSARSGYEFTQTRGAVVLDTSGSPDGDVGLVAVVPVGMSHVASVSLTNPAGHPGRQGRGVRVLPVRRLGHHRPLPGRHHPRRRHLERSLQDRHRDGTLWGSLVHELRLRVSAQDGSPPTSDVVLAATSASLQNPRPVRLRHNRPTSRPSSTTASRR